MAVNALDIWESPVPYRGLGLADITIKAHITCEDHQMLQALSEISKEHDLPICAMEDESAIFAKETVITHIGRIHFISKGKTCPFSPELLNT